MNKKKIYIAIFLLLSTSFIYSFDLSGLLGNSALFDSMFVQMLIEFYSYKYMFIKIMKSMSFSIAVIGSFWWVMKIIIMGESTEKAIVDILVKMFMYIVIVMVYPLIVDGSLALATNIGLARGLEDLNMQFGNMAAEIQLQMKATQDAYVNGLVAEAKILDHGKLKQKAIENFAKKNNVNVDALIARLTNDGINVYTGSLWWKKQATLSDATKQYVKELEDLENQLAADNADIKKILGLQNSGKTNEELSAYYDKMLKAATANMYETANKMKKISVNGLTYEDCAVRLEALARICMSEKESEQFIKDINAAREKLQPLKIEQVMKINPFLKTDSDDKTRKNAVGTNLIISPSSVMRIGLLVASLCNTSTNASINIETTTDESNDNNNNGDNNQNSKTVKKKLQNWLFNNIMNFAINLVIVFGVIMCCVYIIIQYIMMILEFYIVTAISYMLLPLIMWEVTSSYTKNLLKLIVSYFFKTMVMLITVCWAFRQFMTLANILVSVGTTDMLGTLVNVLFTLILCMSFVGEAPKIAQVLLTGNPDMSMGEFMKQVGTTVAAAKIGGKAAKKAGGAALKGAGAIAKGGIATKQMIDAHKEKKGEVSAAKEMQGKAEGELGKANTTLASAKENQKGKAEVVTAAKQEQAAAKQNVAATEKEFNVADKQVEKSQKAYDEAKKKAEGKAEGSKEKLAMQAAASQLLVDQNKRQEARERMDEAKSTLKQKNTNVKSAQTRKNNADKAVEDAQKTVKEKEQFVKDATANVKRVQKTPGARGYAGALMLDGINHSRPVTYAFGGQGAREWADQKRKTGDAAREKKLNRLSDKMNGDT